MSVYQRTKFALCLIILITISLTHAFHWPAGRAAAAARSFIWWLLRNQFAVQLHGNYQNRRKKGRIFPFLFRQSNIHTAGQANEVAAAGQSIKREWEKQKKVLPLISFFTHNLIQIDWFNSLHFTLIMYQYDVLLIFLTPFLISECYSFLFRYLSSQLHKNFKNYKTKSNHMEMNTRRAYCLRSYHHLTSSSSSRHHHRYQRTNARLPVQGQFRIQLNKGARPLASSTKDVERKKKKN